jgi:antitoxin (DNA-binding transcriptional repressor) of toxin-antitoxin stability system
LAGQGQEVLITVRGRVRARLSAVENRWPSDKGVAWTKELRALHRTDGIRKRKTGIEDVRATIREDWL